NLPSDQNDRPRGQTMRTFPLAVAVAVPAFFVVPWTAAQAQTQPAASSTQPQALPAGTPTAVPAAPPQATTKITSYTLPPDLYQKAHRRNRIHFRLALIGVVYGIVVLWLILRWKLSAKYRDWSERVSSNGFLQAVVYSPLLLGTMAVLTLPLDIYGESVEKQYRISVQGWGSWSWDWVKGQLISYVIGIILIWLLYVVIRRSARRWLFYFWLVQLPILLFLTFRQSL